MLKERTLYSLLTVLLLFALAGEQPNMKQDLARAQSGVMRVLRVNEVVYGCNSAVQHVSRVFHKLSHVTLVSN